MRPRIAFWQKVYICALVCFIAGFDVMAYLVVRRSYEAGLNNELATAGNEAYIIKESVEDRLSSVAGYFLAMNNDNIRQYLQPYGQYYANQGIYLAVLQRGAPLYSSMPGSFSVQPIGELVSGERSTSFFEADGRQYLRLAVRMEIPDMIFVYIKDEENLAKYRRDITGYAVKTGTAVSVGLSVLLLLALLGLTRPLRVLGRTAEEIAGGDYRKRAQVSSRDEIGEFAQAFNAMADTIEARIGELSRLTQEKQRFIDNLSHEMRTPVAAVLGYGELLKNADIGGEDRLTAINYIISQSERLKNLSAKLLELSSMQEGAVRMKRVSLSEILGRVRETLRNQLNEKKIVLTVQLGSAAVTGDPDLLESLFLNLLENSVRALHEGGRIAVWSEAAENGARVSLWDNGPGIPPEALPSVAEPFYRVDAARSRSHGGAGLGLSICKRICAVHGADFSIESASGSGTQVKIMFYNCMITR